MRIGSEPANINRNTVEFKAHNVIFHFSFLHINRNTVEFKVFWQCFSYSCESILIETQWNLKSFIPRLSVVPDIILIETQWNLKIHGEELYSSLRRNINRNTVEFKEYVLFHTYNLAPHINRNTVEFKDELGRQKETDRFLY